MAQFHYRNCYRKLTAAVLLSGLIAANADEFKILPQYASNAVSESKAAALRGELPGRFKEQKERFRKLEKDFIATLPQQYIWKKRIEKRAEITAALIRYTDERLPKMQSDFQILMETWRAVDDLESLLNYFNMEKELREELAALPEAEVLSVRDFGAKGDGVTDDSQAFVKALEAARQLDGKPVKIYLPTGTYRLETPMKTPDTVRDLCGFLRPDGPEVARNTPAHLALANFTNLTVEGETPDTTLLCADFNTNSVVATGCRNLTLRNLSVKMAKMPFAQLTVNSVLPREKALMVTPDQGFLQPEDPDFPATRQVTMVITKEGRYHWPSGGMHFSGKKEPGENGSWKVFFSLNFSTDVKPGMKLIIPNRVPTVSGIRVLNCMFPVLENVTIHQSRSAAFNTSLSTNLTMLGCRVLEESRRNAVFSTNADGFHSGNNPIGPYIEKCEFRNMGDDAVNVYGNGIHLIQYNGNVMAPFFWRPGVKVAFYHIATGQISAVAVNTGFDLKTHTATLEEALPESVISGESMRKNKVDAGSGSAEDIYLGLKIVNEPDCYFRLHLSGSGTVITDCSFHDNRNNAVVLGTQNALVERLRVENLMGRAVRMGAFMTWKEGPGSYNVIIRDSFFRNVHLGIAADMLVGGNALAPILAVHGILVRNVTVESSARAIEMKNIRDIRFENCRFSKCQLYLGFADRLTFADCRKDGHPVQPGDFFNNPQYPKANVTIEK